MKSLKVVFIIVVAIVIMLGMSAWVVAQSKETLMNCATTYAPSQNDDPSEILQTVCFDTLIELTNYVTGGRINIPEGASPEEVRQVYIEYNDMIAAEVEAPAKRSSDAMLQGGGQIVLGHDWTIGGYIGYQWTHLSMNGSSGCRHGYQYWIPSVPAEWAINISSAYGVDCEHFPHWANTNYTGLNIDCGNHPACQNLPIGINNHVYSMKLYN